VQCSIKPLPRLSITSISSHHNHHHHHHHPLSSSSPSLSSSSSPSGVGRLPRALSFHLPLHRSLAHCLLESSKHPHLTSSLIHLQLFMRDHCRHQQPLRAYSGDLSSTTTTTTSITWDHLLGTCLATLEVPLFTIIFAAQIKVGSYTTTSTTTSTTTTTACISIYHRSMPM